MKLPRPLSIDRIDLRGIARRTIDPVLRLHLTRTIDVAIARRGKEFGPVLDRVRRQLRRIVQAGDARADQHQRAQHLGMLEREIDDRRPPIEHPTNAALVIPTWRTTVNKSSRSA